MIIISGGQTGIDHAALDSAYQLDENKDINKILLWIKENNIKTLNIAGPRESQSPGIYTETSEFMENFLRQFCIQEQKAEIQNNPVTRQAKL